jgi:hypothetical protein
MRITPSGRLNVGLSVQERATIFITVVMLLLLAALFAAIARDSFLRGSSWRTADELSCSGVGAGHPEKRPMCRQTSSALPTLR